MCDVVREATGHDKALFAHCASKAGCCASCSSACCQAMASPGGRWHRPEPLLDTTHDMPEPGRSLTIHGLAWAMNNMCQHNYTLFGMHVMNVGGTGDIDDCREFIDKRIKEAT